MAQPQRIQPITVPLRHLSIRFSLHTLRTSTLRSCPILSRSLQAPRSLHVTTNPSLCSLRCLSATPTQSQRTSLLLSSLTQRPTLAPTIAIATNLSRGMKVRSSVKKLCDGCKVSGDIQAGALRGKGLTWAVPESRALGGKDTFILFARRIRNISRGRVKGLG